MPKKSQSVETVASPSTSILSLSTKIPAGHNTSTESDAKTAELVDLKINCCDKCKKVCLYYFVIEKVVLYHRLQVMPCVLKGYLGRLTVFRSNRTLQHGSFAAVLFCRSNTSDTYG